jgi:hypothetical protein
VSSIHDGSLSAGRENLVSGGDCAIQRSYLSSAYEVLMECLSSTQDELVIKGLPANYVRDSWY